MFKFARGSTRFGATVRLIAGNRVPKLSYLRHRWLTIGIPADVIQCSHLPQCASDATGSLGVIRA